GWRTRVDADDAPRVCRTRRAIESHSQPAAQRRTSLSRDPTAVATRATTTRTGPQLSPPHEHRLWRGAGHGHDGASHRPAYADGAPADRETVATGSASFARTSADCRTRVGANERARPRR